MSSILLPSRRITNPSGFVEVDRANRFGANLIAGVNGAWVCNALGMVFSASTPGATPNKAGLLNFSGATGNRVEISAVRDLGQAFAIVGRVRRNSAGSQHDGLFDNKRATDWTTSNGVCFNLRGGGGSLFNVGTAVSYTDLTTTFIDGKFHTFAAIFIAGVSQKIYIDKVEVTYTAYDVASGYTHVSTPVAIGSYYDLSSLRSAIADVDYLYAIRGKYTIAELSNLFDAPWQLFKNVQRRIYFDMGAAGGGASTGTLSATQSGDSLTGAAQLVLSATLSAAQDSNTLTGQAALALSGALSIAQASDSLAANGTVASTAITGTLTAAQGANTLSAQGALPIIGTLSASQASNTITTQGVLAIGASLSATQSVNTITAQAALALSGTLSATQVSDTLIANGTSTHSGDLSVTQTGNTLSGLGALSLSGYLAATQADNTLSASAVLAIVGSMSTAQAADVLIATGARDLFGTLAAVQADQALTATGTSVAGLTDSQKIDLILKILSDRQTLDPTTGLYTLYDTDATTVLYTASAWEDTGGTIPYRGQQLQRLDPLT